MNLCLVNDEYCTNQAKIRCKSLCAKHYGRSLRGVDLIQTKHNIRPKKASLGENWCGRCSTFKKSADFSKSRDMPNGLTSICKSCASARWKETYDPERDRVRSIERKYGITPSRYYGMVDSQKGLCAICGLKSKLCVDHCHETGKVRELLCFRCNSTLGRVGDSPELLRKLIKYLEVHGA